MMRKPLSNRAGTISGISLEIDLNCLLLTFMAEIINFRNDPKIMFVV